MDPKLLEEYKEYYKVRAQRYINNPLYKNLCEAENKLYEYINSLDDIKVGDNKAKELAENCAAALSKDKALLEAHYYKEFNETIKLIASQKILEKIENCKTANDVIFLNIDEEMDSNIDVTLDEANRIFIDSWEQLDKIEIYSNAIFPSKYEFHRKEVINNIKKDIKENYFKHKKSIEDFCQSKWSFNPEVIMEYRHRRLLPYSNEQIEKKLKLYMSIIKN